MNDKPLTIEEQIKQTIATTMRQFHQDIIPIIDKAVDKATEKYTNGKLRDFRKDQEKVNNSQNEALEEIKKSVKGAVGVYNGGSNFFRVSKETAIWITAISIAATAVWGLIKFVVLSVIK